MADDIVTDLRVEIAELGATLRGHVVADEAYQRESREQRSEMLTELRKMRDELPKPWGVKELGVVATIVTTLATLIGGLAGLGGSALPSVPTEVAAPAPAPEP